MPVSTPGTAAGQELVRRRHPEWSAHQQMWRFLLDSLESGNQYRFADYSIEPTAPEPTSPWYASPVGPSGSGANLTYDVMMMRNLVPHRRELTADGRDLYWLRLALTPPPRIMARTIDAHLSKVYAGKIARDGPSELEDWWKNVDGKGTDIGRWMEQTVAPVLMAAGQVDLAFDHPAAPPGAAVETRADAERYGLTACVASVILPEDLLWWRLDANGARYTEALVFERSDGGGSGYRHWTAAGSTYYTATGSAVPERSHPHGFGTVPIVRIFDRRRVRCRHVGQSRYEGVADLQKAIYNSRSELALGDVQQSHAQLMAPEDLLQNDAEIPIGPDRILPMKAIKGPGGQTAGYIGPSFLDPPKGAQDAIRQHIIDYQDEAREEGALAKPAGMTGGTTTAQSGISKAVDQQDGNAVLARVAEVLEHCELAAAELAGLVLADGRPGDPGAVTVEYPKLFDLSSADDAAKALDSVQKGASAAGALPLTEGALLKRLTTQALPALCDEDLADLYDEIDAYLETAAAAWHAAPETGDVAGGVSPGDVAGDGSGVVPEAPGGKSKTEPNLDPEA